MDNKLKAIRTHRMLTKSELANRAGLSTVTIDRVEKGYECRMGTKRKILGALGIEIADRLRVFPEDEE